MHNPSVSFGLWLLVLLSIVAAVGATASGRPLGVRVPVLSHCLVDVQSRIEKYDRFNEGAGLAKIEAKYTQFDTRLLTHPELAGFIEVSGAQYDKEFLLSIARGIIQGCSITSEIEFKKKSPGEGEALFRNIEAYENVGARFIYLVNEKDSVRLLIKEKE